MNPLTQLLAELRRHKFATPLALLTILSMLILPLSPAVLDVMFTFNIALAIVVILASVSVRRPLDFSVFPTIILAATLMRLTLNVASTRVVLLHGHQGTNAAGHVIEAFGNVVIGGNFVVGFVVFVILMIINFIVVTKGAERISEVSARFTLDALPGKQMAIDADLNAGLISQEKAQLRRREIAAEADFYGAMDGASKFVRGDAIAGILVLIINVVGGLTIGVMMHDLSFSEALRQYALLTIGDGLVAQIPALLLSASAAIIVTRISDSSDFEQQVSSQLLASPTVLYSAAGLMFILAMIPGMPWLTFIGFATLLAFVGWRVSANQPPQQADEAAQAIGSALLGADQPITDWSIIPYVETLSVSVGYRLAGLLDPAQGAPLVKRVQGIRQSLSESLGFLLPAIATRDDLGLPPSHYRIRLNDIVMAQAEVYADQLMAIPSATVYGEIDGIPAVDPAYQLLVTWIPMDQKAHALGLGYQVVDCATVIATHLAKVIHEQLPELFNYDDVSALLERLNGRAPVLGEALGKALTHNQLCKVCRLLLAENVSLKNIGAIASTLIEAAETTKDPILLAAEVRCALRRQIVASLVGDQSEIKGFNLSSELEGILLGSLNQAQQSGKAMLDNFPVEPNVLSQLQTNMANIYEQMKRIGTTPLLLAMPQLRPLLARYARLFAAGLNVLSYNEIPENKAVKIIGTLG